FLNANLQFSSRDEYRYHEALVHPALAALPRARRGLGLGGGGGLAVRGILKYPSVDQGTLVGLDAEMTRLFSTHPELVRLNQGALTDPRVDVVNADAFSWLEAASATTAEGERYDLAIVDFPDPSSFSLGKLYTTTFYRMLVGRLADQGAMVVQ